MILFDILRSAHIDISPYAHIHSVGPLLILFDISFRLVFPHRYDVPGVPTSLPPHPAPPVDLRLQAGGASRGALGLDLALLQVSPPPLSVRAAHRSPVVVATLRHVSLALLPLLLPAHPTQRLHPRYGQCGRVAQRGGGSFS